MQDFGDWGLLSMWVSDTSFSLCYFVLPDFENIFQRFLYELQARHSYFCIPRNLRSIWCACTDKFYHVAVKHSLELCSFQKNLGRLMAHACINDTALPLSAVLPKITGSTAHTLQYRFAHVQPVGLVQRCWTSWAFADRKENICCCSPWICNASIMWCMCPYFCVGTPGQNYRGNKQVLKAVEN